MSRKVFSEREISRLFIVLDEDRNTFLDEKEIKQWAADLGLQWSYTEVIKIHSIKKNYHIDKAREIIKTADFDTNGKLSLLGESFKFNRDL